jgi:RNA polymerase sigma factor (sigma-70 family)
MADAADLGAFLKRLRRSLEADPAVAVSDSELLDRFVSGNDDQAFTALLRRHGPMVLGVCRRILGDMPAAEDAFQTTFLHLARKAASVLRRGSLAAWLYTVATRTACRARSAAARRASDALLDQLPDPGPDAAAQVERRELCRLVEEEVGRLPRDYRAAVLACYFQGLSCRAAAHHLGCPAGTVAARLSRARDVLRNRLEQRGLAIPGVAMGTFLGALSPPCVEVPLPLMVAAGRAAAGAGAGTVTATGLAKGAWRMWLGRKSLLAAVGLMVGVGVTMALLPGLPQEQAAQASPAPPDRSQMADMLERFQSDDVEVYLAARRRLLGVGQRCRAPLEELDKQLAKHGDGRKLLRVRALLRELAREDLLRGVETGMARHARLSAASDRKKAAKVILLLSRNFCGDLGPARYPDDGYEALCYYSFPKGQHGYRGQVSLAFGNGGDQFQAMMYGGQESGILDLGSVGSDSVTTVPKDLKGTLHEQIKAEVGHVYIEHHLETKDQDLGGFKFKVLDLEPGRWVILAWERIAVEKSEKAAR